jgi:PhnB protein
MKQIFKIPVYTWLGLAVLLFTGYAFISISKDFYPKIKNEKMSQTTSLSTYLLLDGSCKQAMEFYHSCFGGELVMTTVGESPMKSFFPADTHQRIINAKLVSGNINISASDWMRPAQTPIQGNTVCLYLSGGSYSQLKNLFDKLSAGANVTDPLKEEAFGMYGALNDQFGIRWMFYTDKQ